jgi:DNA-directed RNA polymerase subunit RPC12/RpoP
VSSNGSGSFSANLSEGSHTLTIHVPGTGETKSATFTVEYKAPVINSVYYNKEGKLYFSVSNITNLCEAWVDGSSLGSTVSSDGTYPVNKTLAHGAHTLTVYCPDTGKSASYPFTAHTYVKSGAVEPTCVKSGYTAGLKCSECGNELTKPEFIAALGHNYKIVGTNNGVTYYKCSRCGDSYEKKDPNYKSNKNTYGSILKDVNNVYVDYTADGKDKILVITADLKANLTSEIGMYLDADLIAQIQKEGYTAIEYINGEADIVIELAEISDTWFDTDSAIWFYVFSTDPAAEEGTLVKVEAQISGEDKVAAIAFDGVTLKAEPEDLAVTENGVY